MARLRSVFSMSFLIASVIASEGLGQQPNWPQWRGPERDGISKETGLLKSWPAGGPKRDWMFENCGTGFGGPAVVDGRIYIMGARGGEDFLLCLDSAKGTEIWRASMGDALKNDWADGSRGTPSVVEGRVYALSGSGTLICVQARDGREVWRKTMQELGGATPFWGYSESVLVDGNRVLCTPGGKQGAIAAFNRTTGAALWRSSDVTEVAHYSSIIRAEFHGRPQYVQLMEKRLIGLAPDTGELLWEAPFPGGNVAVIPTPIASNGKVFVTAGYGAGCMLVDVAADNTAKVLYDNNVMKNHHGGVVLVGDYIYGHSDDVGWICMNFLTGKRMWRDEEVFDKGAITYSDGLLYCVGEGNGQDDANVALVEPSPDGWKEISRFKLNPQSTIRKPYGRIWTHPVIVGGKLILRDQDKLYCYDVKGSVGEQ